MASNDNEPKIRVHVWLYARDWEKLKEIYGATIKPSNALREITRNFLRQIESRVEAVSHKINDLDL